MLRDFRSHPDGPQRPILISGPVTPYYLSVANSTATGERDQAEREVVARYREGHRRPVREWDDLGEAIEAPWPVAGFIAGRCHVGRGSSCGCGLCPTPDAA